MAYGEKLTKYAEYIANDFNAAPEDIAKNIYEVMKSGDKTRQQRMVEFFATQYSTPQEEMLKRFQDAYDAEAPVLAKEPTPSIPKEEFNQFIPQPQTIPDSEIRNETVPVSRNENEVPSPPKKFEQRMTDPKAPVIKNTDGSISTHKMMWDDTDGRFLAFPSIVEENGALKELQPQEAKQYALRTGEFKEFKTAKEAEDYAAGSWKGKARTIAKAKEVATPNVLPDISQQRLFKPEVKKEDVVKTETVKSTEAEPTKFQAPTVVADLSRQAREKLKESATLQENEKGIITSGLKMGAASGVSGLLKSVPATWNLIATVSDGVNTGLNAALEKVTGERSAFLDKPAPKASAEYLKNIQTGIKGIDTDYFDSIASANNIIQNKFDGKGVIDLIQEDRKSDAAVVLASQVVGTIPQLAALALTRGLGAEGLASTAPLGFMAQGQRAGELAQDDPNNIKTTEQQKALSSAASGVYSTVFELMGTSKIFDRIMRTIKGTAVKEGKEVAKGIFVPVLKDAFKIALMQDAKQEFSEEALTSIAQDITDNAIGVEKLSWKEIGKRAAESGLVGGVTGLGMGGFRVGAKQMSSAPETTTPDKPVEVKTIEDLGYTPESLDKLKIESPKDAQVVIDQLNPEQQKRVTDIADSKKTVWLKDVGTTPEEYAKLVKKVDAGEMKIEELPVPLDKLTKGDRPQVLKALNDMKAAENEIAKTTKTENKEKARIAKEINDNLAKAGLVEKPVVEEKPALTIQGMSVSEFVDKNTDPKTGLDISSLTDKKEIQAVRKEAERRANKAKVDKQKAEIKAKAEAIKQEVKLKAKDKEMDELTAPLSVPAPTAETDVANQPKEATTQTATTPNPDVLTTQPSPTANTVMPSVKKTKEEEIASAKKRAEKAKKELEKVNKLPPVKQTDKTFTPGDGKSVNLTDLNNKRRESKKKQLKAEIFENENYVKRLEKEQADVPSVQEVTEPVKESVSANTKDVVKTATRDGVELKQTTRENGNVRNEMFFPGGGFVIQEKDSNGEEIDLMIKPSKGGDYRRFVRIAPDGSMEINEDGIQRFIETSLSKNTTQSNDKVLAFVESQRPKQEEVKPQEVTTPEVLTTQPPQQPVQKTEVVEQAKPKPPAIEVVAADKETEAITMAIPSQVKEARAAKEKAVTEATTKANEAGYLPEQTSKKVSLFNADPKEVGALNKIARTLMVLSEYAKTTGDVVSLTRLREAVRAYNNIGFKDKVKDDAATYAYKTINKYLATARESQHNKRLVDTEEEADIVRSFDEPLDQEIFNRAAKNYELTEDGDAVDTTEVDYVVGDIIKRYFGGKIPVSIEIKIGGVDSKGQPLNKRAAQISISKDGATIYVNKNLARASTRTTIIHEILGHLGLGGVLKTEPGTYKALRGIYEQEKNAHKMATDRESKEYLDRFGVLDEYADATDDVRFAEWVANIAETYDKSGAVGNRGKAWSAVKDFFRRLYQRIFGLMPTAKIEKIVGDAIGIMEKGSITTNETVADKGVEPKAPKTIEQQLLDIERKANKTVEDLIRNYNPDDADIMRDNLDKEIANIEVDSVFENIKKKVFKITDKLQHRIGIIKRIQEGMERSAQLNPDSVPNVWSMLKRLSSIISSRHDAFDSHFFKPLAQIMKDGNISEAELGEYRMMLHAKEANEALWNSKRAPRTNEAPSGISNQEASDRLAELRADPRAESFSKANAILNDINEYKLNLLVAHGNISQEVADTWRRLYPNHIPLRGKDVEMALASGLTEDDVSKINDAVVATSGNNKQKGISVSADTQKRKARTIAADATLSLRGLVSNAKTAITRANTNDAANKFLDLVLMSPGSKQYWEIITAKQYEELGSGTADKAFSNRLTNKENPPIRETVLKGLKNGKPFYIKINDARLYHAVKSTSAAFTATNAGVNLPIISGLTRRYSQLLTTLNPLFTATNAIRDIQQATVRAYAEDGIVGMGRFVSSYFQTLAGLAQAKWKRHKDIPDNSITGKYYKEFIDNGGRVSRLDGSGMEKIQKAFADYGVAEKAYAETTAKDRAMNYAKLTKSTVGAVVKSIETFNSFFEDLTRVSYFASQRKMGKTVEQAAVAARDVTVDFSQTGDIGAIGNSLYSFFNASLVSTGVVARTVASKRGAAAMTTLAIAGYLLAMYNDLESDKDENGISEWQKREAFKKETRWGIWVGDKFLEVPMPYGFNIFASLGASIYDVQRGYKTPAELATSTAINAVNAYAPLGFGSMADRSDKTTAFAQAVMPTILRPGTDVLLNANFLGQAIHPKFDRSGLAPSMVPGKDTPALYTNLAKSIPMVPLYPDDYEYLLSTLGGAGQILTGGAKAYYDSKAGLGVDILGLPLLKRFSSKPDNGKFYSRTYWDSKNIIKVIGDDIGMRRSEGRDIPEGISSTVARLDTLNKAIDKGMKDVSKLKSLNRPVQAKQLSEQVNKNMMRYYNEIRKATPALEKYIEDSGLWVKE